MLEVLRYIVLERCGGSVAEEVPDLTQEDPEVIQPGLMDFVFGIDTELPDVGDTPYHILFIEVGRVQVRGELVSEPLRYPGWVEVPPVLHQEGHEGCHVSCCSFPSVNKGFHTLKPFELQACCDLGLFYL